MAGKDRRARLKLRLPVQLLICVVTLAAAIHLAIGVRLLLNWSDESVASFVILPSAFILTFGAHLLLTQYRQMVHEAESRT